MPLIHHLYQLQQLDRELASVQRALHRLEAQLAQAPEVQAAQQRLEEAQNHHRTCQRRFQEAEHQTNQLRRKIREIEAQLAGGQVRHPRQVQVLQEELVYLRRKLDEAEEKAIEALMALEEAQEAVAQAQAHLEDVRAQRSQKEAAWRQEQERLHTRREHLLSRREVLVAHLPHEALELYEQLVRQKGGLAVARIQDEACEACGALLSAVRRQAASNLEAVTHCPQCGRILYAP